MSNWLTTTANRRARRTTALRLAHRSRHNTSHLDTVKYINVRTRKVWRDHYEWDDLD